MNKTDLLNFKSSHIVLKPLIRFRTHNRKFVIIMFLMNFYFIFKLYWSCGLHLFTPLPFRPGKGGFGELFRTHLFVNAGNVGDYKSNKTRAIREVTLGHFIIDLF